MQRGQQVGRCIASHDTANATENKRNQEWRANASRVSQRRESQVQDAIACASGWCSHGIATDISQKMPRNLL